MNTVEVRTWLADTTKNVQQKFALMKLERELSKIIITANNHRKNNVPKHAEVYSVLAYKARQKITTFCDQTGTSKAEIYSQMPALADLDEWGSLAPKTPVPVVVIGGIAGIAGVALATVLIGLITGYSQYLFHLGVHISQHTWR